MREWSEKPGPVIVFGLHSPDWMAALHPDAPVWNLLPVSLVRAQLSETAEGMPPDPRAVIIPLMSRHSLAMPKGRVALVARPECIRILSNKAQFADWMSAHGFADLCPAHFSPATARFPLIIKRVNLNGSRGVALASSAAELARLQAMAPFSEGPTLLQAAVPGRVEHVTHFVCRKGQVLWHQSLVYDLGSEDERERPRDIINIQRAQTPAAALDAFRSILRALEYDGPCNADYKMVDGRPVIFEINPRMGGSLMRPENTDLLAQCLGHIIRQARLSYQPTRFQALKHRLFGRAGG